jgi:hypothetical protein
VHKRRGWNSLSSGRGTLNLMRVLMVGLAPGEFGCVWMFAMALPSSGGIKLFRLNTMKAFLTGRMPADYKSLNPRILMSSSYSLRGTMSLNLAKEVKVKSNSTMLKLTRTSPWAGEFGVILHGCHFGLIMF